MRKILVVEDEPTILLMIKEILLENDFDVVTATDGAIAYDHFRQQRFDLVLTDVMMPKMDGYELVEKIRLVNTNIPIIMLTALESEQDQSRAFDLGIDDYIAKPFSILLLIKRIAAVMRRNNIHTTYDFDNVSIDYDTFIVTRDDENMDLTNKEFKILVFLIEHKNTVVNRERISASVWGDNYYGDLRNIDTHIKNIRRKLDTERIITVKGVGYSFVI